MEEAQEQEKMLVEDCPNCGEKGKLVWGEVFCRYYITCETCGCKSRYGLGDLRKAVEYWNDRQFLSTGKSN